jgi:hypothetical protein
MLRGLVIASLSALVALPAFAEDVSKEPGAVFAGLAGSCWRTLLDNKGPDTDTHCFTTAVGGKMLTDTNKVRNAKGEVVYEGVSVYRLDTASGALAYEYFNSMGDLYKGYGWRVGDEIRFSSKPMAEKPDIVWKLAADHYDVTPASPQLGHPGRFVKQR